MPKMKFKSSTLKGATVVSIRHFGPYEEVNNTWAKLTAFAFEKGIQGANVQAIGICYDDPTKTHPERIRYDACLVFDQSDSKSLATLSSEEHAVPGIRIEPFGEVFQAGEGQKIAQGIQTTAAVYQGSYDRICDAYTDALLSPQVRGRGNWPSFEVYKNNPLLTEPDKLVTEIHFQD